MCLEDTYFIVKKYVHVCFYLNILILNFYKKINITLDLLGKTSYGFR